MTVANFRPVVEVIVLSAIAFLIHFVVFKFVLPNADGQFVFPLTTIYLFFSVSAILITLTSVFIKPINIDIVGQAFLLTTFIKMFICFGLFYPKLNTRHEKDSIELGNFIVVFLLFLAIETFVTVRILNKKQ